MTGIVGLTGGIGSGKSAVAAEFEARGVEVADADEVVHALSEPGAEGYRRILAEFGSDAVRDGALDRAWLRRRAFADDAFRDRLEAILHPLVREELRRRVASWEGHYGLLVVPLLLERGGVHDLVQRVLVVDCPEDEQVRRVIRRSGLAAGEVRAIMAKQLSRSERLARADDVIDNGGAPSALGPQVDALDRRYRAWARGCDRSE